MNFTGKEGYKSRKNERWAPALLGLLVLSNSAYSEKTFGQEQSIGSIFIKNRDGAVITVRNFKRVPQTVKIDNTEYVLEGNIDATKPVSEYPKFTISFSDLDDSFGISLNNRNSLGQSRKQAEEILLKDLGIPLKNKQRMCRLNYIVGTGPGVSHKYNGQNLGFSFCPGATVLPTD